MSLQFVKNFELLYLDNVDAILTKKRKDFDGVLSLALVVPQLRRAKHLSHELVCCHRASSYSLEKPL